MRIIYQPFVNYAHKTIETFVAEAISYRKSLDLFATASGLCRNSVQKEFLENTFLLTL